jgi:hypothetical protein
MNNVKNTNLPSSNHYLLHKELAQSVVKGLGVGAKNPG